MLKIRMAYSIGNILALALTLGVTGTLGAADVYKMENQSYPVGQKTLTGLESGTINQGLVVKVLKNGQPAANELIRFHLSSAAGKNA